MESKLKHLEFIQTTINRMANNSFLLKGWAITVVGALLAFSFKEPDCRFVFISFLILILFWFLDGYYLDQEKRFRELYELTTKKSENEIDFLMETRACEDGGNWFSCATSGTLLAFYGGLLVVHIIILIL
jgi:uncharacterized membrane protein